MNLSDRPLAPAPYDLLPPVRTFELTSESFKNDSAMPHMNVGPGDDVSPQLSWSGFPEETKSFVVNCFDPDAPSPSGFWHWNIVDLPAKVTHLDEGAGTSDATLPAGFHVRNDIGTHAYTGPNPPKGDRVHRYFFAVHALDVDELHLGADASPTLVAFSALFHTIARAVIVGNFAQ